MLHKLEVKLLLLTAFILLLKPDVFSQVSKSDSLSSTSLASYPISLYKQATQTESHLFNGPAYVDYRRLNRTGHQFFLQDEKAIGNVHYDGTLYDEVPMLYDMVTDEVVIVTNGFLLQKLVSEKVASFVLDKHTFVRHVAADSSNNTSLSTGFYDMLYDGDTKLLVKRKKQIEYKVEESKEVEKFMEVNKFFIKKGDDYHQVNGGKSVYKVFSDKKKELKRFARSKRFRFKQHREAAILALVQQYDALQK